MKLLFGYHLFSNMYLIPYGLTARIAGFHPAGPGSTPGMGILLFYRPCTDFLYILYRGSFRNLQKYRQFGLIQYGLTARIADIHSAGPGVTPGMGRSFIF